MPRDSRGVVEHVTVPNCVRTSQYGAMAFSGLSKLSHVIAATAATALLGSLASAASISGLLSVGTGADNMRSDAFTESFDKSPLGVEVPTGRLTLKAEAALLGNLAATIVADADSQRESGLDLQEAWLGWNPVPQSPWRTRAKLGAFFPETSLEVGYDSIGWSASRTISSSAINSWIAEEIRVLGLELTQQWRGTLADSPHSFTARAAIFGGNDPAGTEIAWRGWNIGGRITGLYQKLRLPDLPVYRTGAPLANQQRDVHLFRELDGRAGYYGALGYSFDERFDITAMHYDNRGDPLRLIQGQYSWRTRFDHLSVRLNLPAEWELLTQAMEGDTLMGPRAVYVEFSAWYLLLSRKLGPGVATLRHDQFRTQESDILPQDQNQENGTAWALAYAMPLPHSLTVVAEAQRVESQRAARGVFADSPQQKVDNIALELRWTF